MPSLLPARWRSTAGVLGKSIVVVGGQAGLTALSRVDAYRVGTRTWTELKSLPAPRKDLIGATRINGKLYVAGGRSSSGNCVRTLFVYDPATNSWTRKADMPRAGCLGAQANLRGQLYVFTLYTGVADEPTPGLFASYHPSTDKWVRLPFPGVVHQSYPVGGAIHGKFYLTGGIAASGQPDRVLHVYDPATRAWTTRSPMPTGRDGAFATVFQGKLFVAGGVVPRDVYVSTDVVEAYDPATDTWTTGPSMLAPRGFGASAWAAGKFFTIDGITDGALSSRVEALSTPYDEPMDLGKLRHLSE
jgi:N-acetylneuraminic acid mutarotase